MIALDATSTGTAATAVSSISWSHTCTGSNRLLIVGTMARVDTTGNLPVVSVTYNGVALTLARAEQANQNGAELWYLIAPATGANTIVITWTGAINRLAAGGAISLTGAHQSAPADAGGGSNNTVAGATVTATSFATVADNCWVIDALITTDETNHAAGGGQTRFAYQEDVGTSLDSVAMSYSGPHTPAGTVTPDFAWTNVASFAHTAESFQPAPDDPLALGERIYIMP